MASTFIYTCDFCYWNCNSFHCNWRCHGIHRAPIDIFWVFAFAFYRIFYSWPVGQKNLHFDLQKMALGKGMKSFEERFYWKLKGNRKNGFFSFIHDQG